MSCESTVETGLAYRQCQTSGTLVHSSHVFIGPEKTDGIVLLPVRLHSLKPDYQLELGRNGTDLQCESVVEDSS